MKLRRFAFAVALAFALGSVSLFAQTPTTSTKGSTGASSQAGGTSTSSAAKTSKSAQLDINTATKDELKALPGIGDAYSQKIIDGRPYTAKNQLVSKKIIPQSTYDGIKDQIVAHHTTATSSKGTKPGTSGGDKSTK